MAWDWDIGQWFTPPKSKSPWTAMTTGGTNKNSQLERWGPVINSMASVWGNMIFPGAGTVGGALGGGIGMEGRDKGFQGTDYGWGNVQPTISGAVEGAGAGTPMGMFSNYLDTGGSYWNGGKNGIIGGYNTDYDRSKDPKGKQFDMSSMAKTIGSMLGSYYGGQYGGGAGKSLGGMIGGNAGGNLGNSGAGSSFGGMDFSSLFGQGTQQKQPTKISQDEIANKLSEKAFYDWLRKSMIEGDLGTKPYSQPSMPLQQMYF